MRNNLLGVLFVLLLSGPQAQAASDSSLAVRGAVYYGLYQFRSYHARGGFNDGAKSEGFGAGTTYSMGRLFLDLGLDYFQINDGQNSFDFERTDVAVTGGARITDWLGGFGGFRHAWQAQSNNEAVDHPFTSHNGWTENGIFLGPSFGAFAFGPMRLSTSLAYNLNRVSGPLTFSTSKVSYNGVSAKVRLGLAQSPHVIELRYQRFANDKPSELDYNESYFYVGYVFNWALTH